MKKAFISAFGKSYQKSILEAHAVEALLAETDIQKIIESAFNALPEMSGCRVDVNLDLSNGKIVPMTFTGSSDLIEGAHFIRLYSLTAQSVSDICDIDIAGDDEIPEGGVSNFADYTDRVVNVLVAAADWSLDHEAIDEQIDAIYGDIHAELTPEAFEKLSSDTRFSTSMDIDPLDRRATIYTIFAHPRIITYDIEGAAGIGNYTWDGVPFAEIQELAA